MASSTYLTLVNDLLKEFGEPILTSSNFSTVRSVHRMAKQAINRSIDNIQTKEYTWPFNKSSTSQVLTAGTNLYSWPSDLKHPDMESFYIEKDATIGNSTHTLKPISELEWRKRYKRRDLDADTGTGVKIPDYVFRTNSAYGVTPVPNEAYTVYYEYWTTWTRLSSYDDTPSIPTEWDHVILACAYPYMYKFYNNDSEFDRSKADAKEMLQNMRQLLIPKDPKVWVGQLNGDGQYAQ